MPRGDNLTKKNRSEGGKKGGSKNSEAQQRAREENIKKAQQERSR